MTMKRMISLCLSLLLLTGAAFAGEAPISPAPSYEINPITDRTLVRVWGTAVEVEEDRARLTLRYAPLCGCLYPKRAHEPRFTPYQNRSTSSMGRSLFKQVYHRSPSKYSIFCLAALVRRHIPMFHSSYFALATVSPMTFSAPAMRRQAAHSARVAPLVTTSSTRTTCFPVRSIPSRAA